VQTMQLKNEQLEQIGEYVQKQLPLWLDRIPVFSRVYEMDLRERTVRVEEELKSQRELMLKGFENSEKQIMLLKDSMDKQFVNVDKRFDLLTKMMLFGFSLMTAVVTVSLALIHFGKV
jgi:hypothetical protein